MAALEGRQLSGAWSRLDENLKGQHWKQTRLDLRWSDLDRGLLGCDWCPAGTGLYLETKQSEAPRGQAEEVGHPS